MTTIKATILVGIHGSGKTTWSKNHINKTPNTKIINNEGILSILDNGHYTKENDKFVNILKFNIIRNCIIYDKNFIVDDTHCFKEELTEVISYIRKVAEEESKVVTIDVIDFLSDVSECTNRSFIRPSALDIRGMYNMFVSKENLKFKELDIDNYVKIE